METRMTRTFHPVGQGAFYTEQFGREGNGSEVCIVYDCGTKTSQEHVDREKVVKDALGNGSQPVDILFISHFAKPMNEMLVDSSCLLNRTPCTSQLLTNQLASKALVYSRAT